MQACTRRSFAKGAVVAGVAGVAAGLASAGRAQADEWAGYTPGTYTAQVMGHNAPFTVTCTFTQYALSDIDTSGNNETIGVGKYALETLAHEVVKSQSLNVDAVSGASISSYALLGGIEDCAEQAGGAEQLKAVDGPADVVEDSYDADVAVIGAGGAGQRQRLGNIVCVKPSAEERAQRGIAGAGRADQFDFRCRAEPQLLAVRKIEPLCAKGQQNIASPKLVERLHCFAYPLGAADIQTKDLVQLVVIGFNQ